MISISIARSLTLHQLSYYLLLLKEHRHLKDSIYKFLIIFKWLYRLGTVNSKSKNWELAVCLACNYPCSFDKSQNILKQSCILGLLGGELLNPQDRGLKSLLSWRGEGHVCSTPCLCICMHLRKSWKHHFQPLRHYSLKMLIEIFHTFDPFDIKET